MALNNYVTLKLIERIESLQGRKKLQKLMFIAKLEGCPIDDDFFHHFYGPYSSDLAERVDDLVERGLLKESSRSLGVVEGVEYSYEVADPGKARLRGVDEKLPKHTVEQIEEVLERVVPLASRNVFELELAATILYWLQKGHDWKKAEVITSQRKSAGREDSRFKSARKLAEQIWQQIET